MIKQSATKSEVPKLVAQPKFQAAISLLLEARLYAEKTGSSPWEFAVEAQELARRGLTVNDLRLLTRLKFVEHAWEVTALHDPVRRFTRTSNGSFSQASCFVLTTAGVTALASTWMAAPQSAKVEVRTVRIMNADPEAVKTAAPHWNRERRLLTFDGVIVKQFRWPATNQERILSTFEEENWPVRILDPLAPAPEQVIKQRLRETIKSLNRGQTNAQIHFRGDGTGAGIIWEAVD